MSTEQFTASVLVNRGLQAASVLDHPDVATAPGPGDAAAPARSADVLRSFRDIALNPQVQLVAPELAGIIGGFMSTADIATWAIDAKYAETGGADGVLGRSVGAVTPTPNQAGFSRSFVGGTIYWHPNTGAHALHGPILARWRELGAEAGFLGFATSDVTPGADVRAEGSFAHFQGGSIYWAPPSRFGALVGGMSVAGTATGVLPATATGPQTPIKPAPPIADGTVAAGGADKPAVKLSPLELLRTAALDGAAGAQPLERSIGTTTTAGLVGAAIAERPQVDATARIDVTAAAFQSSSGAFEVHGAIREKYLALGAEASVLGYPRTDESGTPDGRGRFNHFQGGSIYWTADTGAHEVHGLIRDRWSALGWERNPQLGYPISDELIPDPRVGHRRPEVIKKPIPSLPVGVTKLPAAAIDAGFPPSVVNTPPAAAATIEARVAAPAAKTPVAEAALRATTLAAPARVPGVGALGRLSSEPGTPATVPPAVGATPQGAASPQAAAGVDAPASDLLSPAISHGITLDPAIVAFLNGPASTPGQRSVNRFADFESGVLFWFRGATSASVLTPLAATGDGTSLAFSGDDIAALTVARLGRASLEFANAQLVSLTFIGTTPYSHDGAQVHNRRHRLQLVLRGLETQVTNGPLGISIPQVVPVTAGVELQVEVWFDAADRRIALALVDWSLSQSSSQSYAAAVEAGLRARLDPLVWQSFEVLTLPDTNDGAAMAVLSVKTLANGAVVVFIEPRHVRLLDGIGDLGNVVAPTVIHFAQPN